MEIKQLDETGIEFLIKEEGLVLKPYLDSVGVATIGVGCTYYPNGQRVTMKDKPLTKPQAIELFKTTLEHYEKSVWSITRDDITQNQFNALVSLCFNIGSTNFRTSTLLKRVNARMSNEEIHEAFTRWKFAGGKPILLNRRHREFELYETN